MYVLLQDQGHREYMEDMVDIAEHFYKNLDYYAVFDGHGGDKVAIYLKSTMRKTLLQNIKIMFPNVSGAIYKTFADVAEGVNTTFGMHTGSTALVIIKSPTDIWAANAGDCRAILKYFDNPRYVAKQLTKDHKPNDPDEEKRIRDANGFISQDPYGTWRVGGNLAVSRSFGDLYLSPWVTWKPDIYHVNVTQDIRAIFMASDGIWDTMSDQDVVNVSYQVITKNLSYDPHKIMTKVCNDVTDLARKRGSTDNISIIFIVV
jgi:serine/threonine protein phosphatase PrpC